jgi:hypothetical protein
VGLLEELGITGLLKFMVYYLLLPPSLNVSIPSIQTQKITELVKDIYTHHFTLSTNSPPTHQLLYFCPIHRNAYIVSKILNLRNANIKGRREYLEVIV